MVVGSRVDDPVRQRGSRTGAGCGGSRWSKANWSTTIPGNPSSSRSRSTAGVITPRSSAISGRSGPSARPTASNTRAARPALPAPADGGRARRPEPPSRRRSRGSGRSARGRTARSVCRSRSIHHRYPRRRSAGQSYSGLPHSCPVRENASGGAPATMPSWKSSGWRRGRRCPATRRSRRRRTGARRRRPRSARSARHSRSNRTWSATAPRPSNRSQSPIQNAWRSRKSSTSAALTGARGDGQQARPRGERRTRPCTASGSGRAARAAASATTTGRRRPASRRIGRPPRPSRPPGSEVRWSWTPLERAAVHASVTDARRCFTVAPTPARLDMCRPACPIAPAEAHRDPVPDAHRRRRTVPRQAVRRRRRRCLGRRLPRWPRPAARRRPLSRARRQRRWREAALHRIDAQIERRPLGGRVRRRRRGAVASTRSRPGPTCSGPGATSCDARSPAGQHDLAGEISEGALLLKAAAANAKNASERRLIDARARRRSTTARSRSRRSATWPRRRAVRRGRAHAGAPRPAPRRGRS